ncbi:MAG: right-handed parallel beta-helix repeat-containing protein [Planctomycetota bacterium]
MNKQLMLALAAGLSVGTLLADGARSQQWISPQIGGERQAVDAWVQPAAAYQPPGRAYAVNDRFPATAQLGTAPIGAAPVAGGVAVPAVPYNAQGLQQPGAFNTYAPPAGTGLGPITVAPGQVMQGGQVVGPYVGSSGPCGPVCGPSCGPVIDPYAACTPTLAAPAVPVSGGWRRPFAELEGRIGDEPETLQGNLFVPFLQRPNAFWFADIRGHFDDEQAAEGNWGVAYRRLYGDLIWGFYGFYDLRHTQFNNNFHGATFGIEALDLNWEARFNWYIPEGGSKPVPALNQLGVVNNAVVFQNGIERALYGFDGEVGRLIWRGGGLYDAEVRAFIGGYYFDTTAAGFNSIGGPRARIEGRLYDLPRLGPGSRLTFGGVVQYDDVRDVQGIASVNLRIPFGAGNAAAGTKLSPMERRMLSPIRRDDDIVTQTGFANEQAFLVASGNDGLELSNVTEVKAGQDLPTRVSDGSAAGSNIFVVTGDVSSGATATLSDGQFLGGQFPIRNGDGSRTATFGQKFRVTGTNAANDVIQIAANSQVVGLSVTGGQNGISGGALDGFNIENNTVASAAVNGIALGGSGNPAVGGQIAFNRLEENGRSGLEISSTSYTGTISNNEAVNNTGSGFVVGLAQTGSLIQDNLAQNNRQHGYEIGALLGGLVSQNRALENDLDGFVFGSSETVPVAYFGPVDSGVISMNHAMDNGHDGFQFRVVQGGTISMNTAVGNNTTGGFGGFNFFSGDDADEQPAAGTSFGGTAVFTGNTTSITDASGVTTSGNRLDGFAFGNVTGGTISNNTATGNNTGNGVDNGNGGFSFFDVTGGKIDGNEALMGQSNGFVFFNEVTDGAEITRNDAIGNDADGFQFTGGADATTELTGGKISGNVARGNGEIGFNVFATVIGGEISSNTAGGTGADEGNQTGFSFQTINEAAAGDLDISNNDAIGNSESGFAVADLQAGTLRGNRAIQNTVAGFSFSQVTGGLITENDAGSDSMADANGIGIRVGSFQAGVLDDNNAFNNTGDGFQFAEVAGINAAAVTISQNDAVGNTGNGFLMFDFLGGTFQDNEANSNGMMQFDVAPDPPNSVAAGNTTNGNPVPGL